MIAYWRLDSDRDGAAGSCANRGHSLPSSTGVTPVFTTCFALDHSRPLAAFAGIWTNWTSVRKMKEGEVNADIFAFLTTEANAEVAPIHAKAMPVILRTDDEIETWLKAPAAEALALQRPLPDGALQIVAKGARQDDAPFG